MATSDDQPEHLFRTTGMKIDIMPPGVLYGTLLPFNTFHTREWTERASAWTERVYRAPIPNLWAYGPLFWLYAFVAMLMDHVAFPFVGEFPSWAPAAFTVAGVVCIAGAYLYAGYHIETEERPRREKYYPPREYWALDHPEFTEADS